MNKKASMLDKLYIIGIFAAAVVIMIVVGYAWSVTQPILKGLGNTKTVDLMNELEPTDVINWFDIIIVFVYFGLSILVCIILPLYVENNPVFFGVLFALMFFLLAISAYLGNALIDFIEGFNSNYSYTLLLLNNIVGVEAIFILALLFISFFKFRKQEETYY